MNIIVKIESVDMNGFCGRDNHPQPAMVGRFVRIVELNTYPFETSDDPEYNEWHILTGFLLDDNGENTDIKVDLVDDELMSEQDTLVLFTMAEVVANL